MRRANEPKVAHPEPTSAPKPGKTNPEKAQISTRAPKNPAKVGAISQHTKNMQAKRDDM
jgi:hypothetical protein